MKTGMIGKFIFGASWAKTGLWAIDGKVFPIGLYYEVKDVGFVTFLIIGPVSLSFGIAGKFKPISIHSR